MRYDHNFLCQYQTFCASKLNTETSIEADLDALSRNPLVAEPAFYKPHIFMVGTEMIEIIHEDEAFPIGEFILFIMRRRQYPVWEASFRFANPTGIKLRGMKNYALHPHIVSSEFAEIEGVLTGSLCISQGASDVYRAIRLGRMSEAVTLLLRILGNYRRSGAHLGAHVEEWRKK